MIDREKSQEVLNLVLGNITLPLFDTTEREMLQNIQEWGYADVMENIWFCHNPIGGKPCGMCSPCHTKMESDMEFLIPEESRRRYKRISAIEKRFGKYAAKGYSVLVHKMKSI